MSEQHQVEATAADTEDQDDSEADAEGSASTSDGTNDTRIADLMKLARRLGSAAGIGAESLPTLGFEFARLAADGAIPADDKSTVPEAYDNYMATQAKKRVLSKPQSKGSRSAQIAKLNAMRNMGYIPWGEAHLDKARDIREKLIAEDVKPRDAFDALVAVSRQAKEFYADTTNSREPTDDEIRAVMLPKETSKDVVDIIQEVEKKLKGLLTGELKGKLAGLKCQDQEVIDAQAALEKWLTNFTVAEQFAEMRQFAAQHGLTITSA